MDRTRKNLAEAKSEDDSNLKLSSKVSPPQDGCRYRNLSAVRVPPVGPEGLQELSKGNEGPGNGILEGALIAKNSLVSVKTSKPNSNPEGNNSSHLKSRENPPTSSPSETQLCPNCHPMIKVSNGSCYENDSVMCDDCKQKCLEAEASFWHCNDCDYDLCRECGLVVRAKRQENGVAAPEIRTPGESLSLKMAETNKKMEYDIYMDKINSEKEPETPIEELDLPESIPSDFENCCSEKPRERVPSRNSDSGERKDSLRTSAAGLTLMLNIEALNQCDSPAETAMRKIRDFLDIPREQIRLRGLRGGIAAVDILPLETSVDAKTPDEICNLLMEYVDVVNPATTNPSQRVLPFIAGIFPTKKVLEQGKEKGCEDIPTRNGKFFKVLPDQNKSCLLLRNPLRKKPERSCFCSHGHALKKCKYNPRPARRFVRCNKCGTKNLEMHAQGYFFDEECWYAICSVCEKELPNQIQIPEVESSPESQLTSTYSTYEKMKFHESSNERKKEENQQRISSTQVPEDSLDQTKSTESENAVHLKFQNPKSLSKKNFKKRLISELSALLEISKEEITLIEKIVQKNIVCVYFSDSVMERSSQGVLLQKIQNSDQSRFPIMAELFEVGPHCAYEHKVEANCYATNFQPLMPLSCDSCFSTKLLRKGKVNRRNNNFEGKVNSLCLDLTELETEDSKKARREVSNALENVMYTDPADLLTRVTPENYSSQSEESSLEDSSDEERENQSIESSITFSISKREVTKPESSKKRENKKRKLQKKRQNFNCILPIVRMNRDTKKPKKSKTSNTEQKGEDRDIEENQFTMENQLSSNEPSYNQIPISAENQKAKGEEKEHATLETQINSNQRISRTRTLNSSIENAQNSSSSRGRGLFAFFKRLRPQNCRKCTEGSDDGGLEEIKNKSISQGVKNEDESQFSCGSKNLDLVLDKGSSAGSEETEYHTAVSNTRKQLLSAFELEMESTGGKNCGGALNCIVPTKGKRKTKQLEGGNKKLWKKCVDRRSLSPSGSSDPNEKNASSNLLGEETTSSISREQSLSRYIPEEFLVPQSILDECGSYSVEVDLEVDSESHEFNAPSNKSKTQCKKEKVKKDQNMSKRTNKGINMRKKQMKKRQKKLLKNFTKMKRDIVNKGQIHQTVTLVECPRRHKLRALKLSKDNGWNCDASESPVGCARGICSLFQSKGVERYRCEDCDYDLCDWCFFREMTEKSQNRRKQRDSVAKLRRDLSKAVKKMKEIVENLPKSG